MPLDQMCLLSLTSTRTSAVFMTLWANFFTCGREGGGKGEVGQPRLAMRANARGGHRKPRRTADTARGALFLKVIPWTALARLMVYSRVTGSVDLPPMAAECLVVQLLRLPKRSARSRGGPALCDGDVGFRRELPITCFVGPRLVRSGAPCEPSLSRDFSRSDSLAHKVLCSFARCASSVTSPHLLRHPSTRGHSRTPFARARRRISRANSPRANAHPPRRRAHPRSRPRARPPPPPRACYPSLCPRGIYSAREA